MQRNRRGLEGGWLYESSGDLARGVLAKRREIAPGQADNLGLTTCPWPLVRVVVCLFDVGGYTAALTDLVALVDRPLADRSGLRSITLGR